MTPASLILARNGSGTASAAAKALWDGIVGAAKPLDADYASPALDLIAKHVGTATDVPDAVLREAVVRLGFFLRNTMGPSGAGSPGVGFKGFKVGELEWEYTTEYHGAALRKSGVMGLLIPWTAKRAGAI